MNSNIYNIDYKRLVIMLLPTMLRRPIIAAIVTTMVSPLLLLHRQFLDFRADTNYRLMHNGQTCYLRAVLNDNFDPIERRITVTDGYGDVTTTSVLAYKREVDKPKRLALRGEGAVILNKRGFSGASGFDFLVNVPSAVSVDESRLRALTNMYKLAGKRHAINYV